MSGGRGPRFLPWSVPLAVGVALGVVLGAALPGVLQVLAFGLVAAAAAAARRAWGLPTGTLTLLLVGVLAGGARWALWAGRPDPVAPLVGRSGTYHGRYDGTTLRLDEAGGAKVALVTTSDPPTGRLTLRGELERPPGRRNPGGFDLAAYLRRRGVRAQLFVDEVVDAEPHATLLGRLRRGATAGLPPPRAAVMEAMTLGIREDLGDLRQRFAAAGLSHVLALSGLHVGVLVLALGRALAPLGRRRYPWLMAATVGYVALVGPSPSVVRAGCMVVAGLASLAAGFPRIPPWPSLSLAAVVGLMLSPAQLMDPSFQLSYLAVIGMLVFAPPLVAWARPARAWWHPRTFVLAASAVSVAAQLPSLSLVASSFGRVPLLSPLVNVLAVPLAGVLVPMGFASALLGLVALPVASLLNHVVSPLAGLLLALADLGARLPALAWGEVSWVGHVLLAVALAAVALALHGRLRPWRALLVVVTAALASLLLPPAHGRPEVVFLDVGQGDATLIRLPGSVDVLVDGGGTPFSDRDVGRTVVLPALRALGVWDLDAVVATHADLDHVEGLLPVLTSLPVGMLVMGPVDPSRPIDAALRAAAEARGVPVVRAVRGQRWVVGDGPGQARFDVLNPPRTPADNANDNSVALVLRLGGTPQVLMLGDASAAVERVLAVPRVPVLKVAHHGSPHSSSDELLRAARPRLAVVSVGRNGYGHPSPEVLRRLAAAGAEIVTTQASGALRLRLSPSGPGPVSGTTEAVPVGVPVEDP